MRQFFIILTLICSYITKIAQQDLVKTTNCVACKFIWESIEEALGDSQRNSIIVAESFQYYCKISPDIFFQPCNEMFEKLSEMSEKFTQKQNVIQLCNSVEMCEEKQFDKVKFNTIKNKQNSFDYLSLNDEENNQLNNEATSYSMKLKQILSN